MRGILVIVSAALLPITWLGAPPASAQESDDTTAANIPSSGEITLFHSSDRILVMMKLADGEVIPMAFDTGSDGNTIDRSIAERLGLKQVGLVREIDGTTLKERILPNVAVQDIAIGGLKVGAITATSVDIDFKHSMGIISPEIFNGSLVYLDLSNNHASLSPRETTAVPSEPANEYADGLPSIRIMMPNGQMLPATFDTGYNGTLSLPTSMMDKVPLKKPAKVVGRFKSINTEGPVYGGRIEGTIRIGPVVLENPRVTFLGNIANIGLPIIRKVALVLDPVANRNWVLASGARLASAQ